MTEQYDELMGQERDVSKHQSYPSFDQRWQAMYGNNREYQTVMGNANAQQTADLVLGLVNKASEMSKR